MTIVRWGYIGKQALQLSAKGDKPVGDYDKDADADEEEAVEERRSRDLIRTDQPRWTDQHHQTIKVDQYRRLSGDCKQAQMKEDEDSSLPSQSSSGDRHQPVTQCLEHADDSDQLCLRWDFTKSEEMKKQSEPRLCKIYGDRSVNSQTRDDAVTRCRRRSFGFDYTHQAEVADDRGRQNIYEYREAGDDKGAEVISESMLHIPMFSRRLSDVNETSRARRNQSTTRSQESQERGRSDYVDDDEFPCSQRSSLQEASYYGHPAAERKDVTGKYYLDAQQAADDDVHNSQWCKHSPIY